jgi:hypothetical protein
MCPDSNLREQRELIRKLTIQENRGKPFNSDDVSRLVELAYSLDEWLTSGGHLPVGWVTV